jgi:hypothetical protein
MTTGFGLVALPLPLAEPYTYKIPEALADRVVPGARVRVPVRRREMTGIVVAVEAPAPDAEAREILAALDGSPRFRWRCSVPRSGSVAITALPSASPSAPLSRQRYGGIPSPAGPAMSPPSES